MLYQTNCLCCRQPLYFLGFGNCKENCLVAICHKYKYKYALVPTEIFSFSSKVEVSPNNEYSPQSRSYQLRLIQADGTLKSLKFSTPGRSEKISGLPGDQVLLLYTMRGKELENLVWIENSTIKKSHILIKPDTKAHTTGIATAALTLVGSSILAGFFQIPTNQLFWATTIPSSIGVAAYVTKRSSIKVRDYSEVEQLTSEQKLLAQYQTIEQKSGELTQELEINRRLIQHLKALHEKMIGFGEALYEDKAETVAKAITVLEKQFGLTRDLINNYLCLAKIVEIEYQTSQLAFQLPGDTSEKILIRLEELKVIESTKEELSLLVNPQKLLAEYQQDQS